MISGGTGLLSTLPPAVRRAVAISPDPGTTFLDAEHVVILMQENRSFDHLFGTLKGVRGFNDPRAIRTPDGNLTWLQTDDKKRTYLPFRLDIKDTRATWMSSLPHSWASQVAARHGGRHDRWLQAKRSGNPEFKDMPLTMGFYNREDLPFYYGLADAFTVSDQYFCSSLTGTTPNRLFLWTGTVRAEPSGDSPANVDNSDVDYDSPATWTTFPERLESAGVSWKVYQNELSVPVGFDGDQDAWLANFTDNPLEWFTQYQVGFLDSHTRYLASEASRLEKALEETEASGADYAKMKKKLESIRAARERWSQENWAALPDREKALHRKGFTTNLKDPDYHSLTELDYSDGGVARKMKVPRGDVFHQFRQDVNTGRLPTVSWLVAPENFSDHPGAPWYGAWYVSETLDILTRDPDVWKKTILILCYDENDGYFDHVPPFTAPDPGDPSTGRCSAGIDTQTDYITPAQAAALKGKPKDPVTSGPVGLGFRVPFVIASPWTRGGWVNSEVFDHTSVIRFLERFVSAKAGSEVTEPNISSWRRTVTGDLSSMFRPYAGERIKLPGSVKRDPFLEEIYNSQFKKLPAGFKELTPEDIARVNRDPASEPLMPRQEKGTRPACALPYELYADGAPDTASGDFSLSLSAGRAFFGAVAAGAPFTVYLRPGFTVRNYAVRAGDTLREKLPASESDGSYHVEVRGPNGFLREFRGQGNKPVPGLSCRYETDPGGKVPTGHLLLEAKNDTPGTLSLLIRDERYGAGEKRVTLAAKETKSIRLDTTPGKGWYDFSVTLEGNASFRHRYAGRVETGKPGITDPAMA
jgi:phospholipase C